MIGKYKVHCRAAAYDEENGMIVLVCFFEDVGQTRIVYFSKSDFHYKYYGTEVPNEEMHKTAEMFRNRKFFLIIESDPNRSLEADNNPAELAQRFVEYVKEQMGDITEKLSDSDRVLIRRLGDVVERDHKKRFGNMLADEMIMRAKLKGLDAC